MIFPNAKPLGIGGGGLLVLFLIIMILPNIADKWMTRKAKEARWARRGARAEKKVGGLLEGLFGEFEILHDVVCAYGNIDHVVISPKGSVFMIETKSHGGKVTTNDGHLLVNGNDPEKDFIAQSLRNSYWLRDQIEQIRGSKPWVTPILVFTNAFVSFPRPIKGVTIINKKFLANTIQSIDMKNMPNLTIRENREKIVQKLLGK